MGIRDSYRQARSQQDKARSDRMYQRALAKAPGASDWVYVEVQLRSEMRMLLGQGWELVSQAQYMSLGLGSKFHVNSSILRKAVSSPARQDAV
jgi:hypothetical protein